jgi:hypothetical protein
MMNASEIVEVIKRRRDSFWDLQIEGTSSDDPVYSGADLARAKADEYDDLLVEIGAITPQEARSA